MKAIQVIAPSTLELTNIVTGDLKQWQVRIAVAISAVCGSDLKIIRNPTVVPQVPGHEFSGFIIEVGSQVQKTFKIGDRVTAFPMIGCLKCDVCLSKNYRDCEFKLSLGNQLQGSFSEEIIVDSRFVIQLKDSISMEQGALLEHLCCGYRVAKDFKGRKVKKESHIAIIGDGPIAMADLQMLKFFEYKNITLIGKHKERILLGLKLGASHALNYYEAANFLKEKKLPSIDVCIFAAQADETLARLLKFIKPMGLLFQQTRVRHPNVLKLVNQASISSFRAFAYEIGDFQEVMNLIDSGEVNTELLISRRLGLEDVPDKTLSILNNKGAGKTIIFNKNINNLF